MEALGGSFYPYSHPPVADLSPKPVRSPLIILSELAGATFQAYTDSSAVDCCFELLKGHCSRDSVKWKLVQVRAPPILKGGHRVQTDF